MLILLGIQDYSAQSGTIGFNRFGVRFGIRCVRLSLGRETVVVNRSAVVNTRNSVPFVA
jgi:hypothetical protein